MVHPKDLVIFLGAGFSHDAGLPIMANFGPKSLENYNGLREPKNKRTGTKIFIDAADVFYAFQDLCRQSPTVTSADADNLETVFCIAAIMREAEVPTITLKGKAYTPDQVIENIQIWLWKIYQQFPIENDEREMVNPDRKTREDIYKEFFALVDDKICNRTTFISTNYDLTFEYMLSKNGKQCTYPGSLKTINIGCGRNYVCVNQSDLHKKALLCKLHGSVNFFDKGGDDLFVSVELAGDKPILDSKIKNYKPAIFSANALYKIRQVDPLLKPAIIPPTYAKLERKNWLREIWSHTFNAFRTANTIIFIGYSMPPTDGFMKALIHAALASRTQKRGLNIFVIDPKLEVHNNYSNLFGASYRDIGRNTLGWVLNTGKLKRVLENN